MLHYIDWKSGLQTQYDVHKDVALVPDPMISSYSMIRTWKSGSAPKSGGGVGRTGALLPVNGQRISRPSCASCESMQHQQKISAQIP